MTMRAYPRYKDSGVEWLGQIPEHWSHQPLKRSASHNDEVVDETTSPDEEILYVDISSVQAGEGIVKKEAMSFSAAPSRARRRVRDGDTIISTVRTYLRAVAAIRDPEPNLVVSTGFAVVRPGPDLHSGFLAHLLRSAYFVEEVVARSVGISYPAINASDLVRIAAVIPPLPEQGAIAAFLDRETAKIDALVAAQRRLIELLTEKRRAVISHAVTKGLNPDAPMKHSGIDWLGEVPEHWEVCHVRRLIQQIEQGWSPDCYSWPADDDEAGVLKTGCVNHGVFNQSENKALPPELQPIPAYEVRYGDILMSRASGSADLVGATALATPTREGLYLSDKTFRLRLYPELVNDTFFVLAFNSQYLRQQIERSISGAGGLAKNLPQSTLREFLFCLPPCQEQIEIASETSRSAHTLTSLISEAEAIMSILQERRTALISAAVTGKIDVRGSVPATPEEVGV